MIAYPSAEGWFQLRAAAVIVHDRSVLLQRARGNSYWSLPGGRVELLETGATAIMREMREEIGEQVVVGDLIYVVENFFEASGKKIHEIGLFYHVQLSATSTRLDKAASFVGASDNAHLEFSWMSQRDISKADIRPRLLASALSTFERQLQHVTRIFAD